jgi:hypothetical protein
VPNHNSKLSIMLGICFKTFGGDRITYREFRFL